MEIQVRTVFEDVWSEIDHRLIYKGFHVEHQNATEFDKYRPFARQLAVSLKNHFEACSDTADNLKRFVSQLTASYITSSKQKSDSFYPKRLGAAAARAGLTEQFGTFTSLLNEIYENNKTDTNVYSTAIEIGKALCALREVESNIDLNHLLRMEIALLFINRAESKIQTLHDSSSVPSDDAPLKEDTMEQDLATAFMMYTNLSRELPHKSDPMIYYRIGTIQFLTNKRSLAFSYFVEAQDYLKDPTSKRWLDSDDIMRIEISWRLATEYYFAADELRFSPRAVRIPDAVSDIKISNYRKSAQLAFETFYLIDRKTKQDSGDEPREKLSLYKRRVANVGLDAALMFCRSLGVNSSSDAKFEDRLNDLSLSKIDIGAAFDLVCEDKSDAPGYHDTLRSYYLFFDMLPEAKHEAKIILAILERDEAEHRKNYKNLDWVVDDMIRQARETLELGE